MFIDLIIWYLFFILNLLSLFEFYIFKNMLCIYIKVIIISIHWFDIFKSILIKINFNLETSLIGKVLAFGPSL